MGFPLTEEQRQAVTERGGALLVSAAAGSGKTRVLVERLLDRVERGSDIDRFLVITYTRAAAAELRARIADELSGRLAQRPGDRHLRRQTALVYKAQISTIHAFCADLLRECGHLLDLEPDFRLCDEQEGGVLRQQVLEEVLEARYEDLDPEGDFAQLVDTLSAGRDDSLLMQIVLDMYDKVQSHPDPQGWLAEQLHAYDLKGIADAADTPWGALILDDAAEQVRYWRGRMAECLRLTDTEAGLSRNYGPTVAETMAGLDRFLAAAEEGWDAAAGALPIPFPTAGRKKMEATAEAERVKSIRKTCKDRMEKLAQRFADGSAALLSDLRAVTPAVRGLFSLLEDFSHAFDREKRRRGLLDFSDLEHCAVALLTDREGAPTPLALEWSRRYEEIMVDEYQDTNQVQNAIFTALSREGRNLFLVGDVKQSIYRFRLADPTIFLEKYRTFRPADRAAEGEPRKLILSRNFRSRGEILSAVNDVFSAVMSPAFGEMAYTDQERLYPGAEYPPAAEPCVELTVIDMQGEADGEEAEGPRTDRSLLEARWAARRIRELLESRLPVREGDGQRPLRPEDVVILLRSPGTVLHHYVRALNEQGIPWQAEGDRDFFAATEVNVALSLLQVVDNPRQDVPLISVLRSPVYGFSADRLAHLRAGSEGDFYSAVVRAAQEGEEDCRRFLDELKQLRLRAGERAAHELIWELYDRTGLPALFGAMPGGEERRGNLLTLYELARSCEEGGHKGLFGFLTYLERLKETGGRVAVSAPGREGGGVRLMSIHKSKGLEFPVVFLCGLSKRLNREDLNKPVLFHPKLGVGPKWLDRERMIQSTTLARRGVSVQLLREMMAEELRLLYVAMTRAREKLILSCTLADSRRELDRLWEDAGFPVEPQALLSRDTVGQWVLLAALCRPEAGVLRPGGCPSPVPAEAYGTPWRITLQPSAPLEQPARQEVRLTAAESWDLSGLEERLRWRYPYAASAHIPSKLTATQLKGRELDREAAEEAPRPPRTGGALRRPRFAEEALGLTPAERGVAQHLAMQYLDFAAADSRESLTAEVARLVERELLTPVQGAAVEVDRLLAFFRSPLGRQVRESRGLHREFKFSLLVPADRYYRDSPPGEEVLLQGVVDCWLDEPEGIVLIDFKTDRVTPESVQARAEEYRPQMEAYRQALERITGRKVVRRALWFFCIDRAVEL